MVGASDKITHVVFSFKLASLAFLCNSTEFKAVKRHEKGEFGVVELTAPEQDAHMEEQTRGGSESHVF